MSRIDEAFPDAVLGRVGARHGMRGLSVSRSGTRRQWEFRWEGGASVVTEAALEDLLDAMDREKLPRSLNWMADLLHELRGK
jgi:hypothetical protein